MKHAFALAAIVASVLLAGLAGCSNARKDDERAIKSLLGNSGYTNDNQTSSYGAEDSTLEDGSGSEPGRDGYERIPFVRFRRYIAPNGVSRTVDIQIPAPGGDDTTALATITQDVNGELRTVFDTTTNPIHVWRKPFHDKSTRKVYLTKSNTGWHIRKLSPLKIETQDPAYHLAVTRVYAVGRLSGDTFELTTTDTLLTKEQLPRFLPNDTVLVSVSVTSDGDSCWAFLHHGRPGHPRVWRRPYFKTGTFTFERVWVLGDETYDSPEVRPSIHDAIGWGTLWTDTTSPYVASAWGIPYIVKHPSEAIPDDQ